MAGVTSAPYIKLNDFFTKSKTGIPNLICINYIWILFPSAYYLTISFMESVFTFFG